MRSDTSTMEREIIELQAELAVERDRRKEAVAIHTRERAQLEARIIFLTERIASGMSMSMPAIAISCDDAALRDKAVAFDVLSERILAGNWHVGPGSIGYVLIDVMTKGERIHGATLAEAVRLATEAEGK